MSRDPRGGAGPSLIDRIIRMERDLATVKRLAMGSILGSDQTIKGSHDRLDALLGAGVSSPDGTLVTGFNADKLDGLHASEILSYVCVLEEQTSGTNGGTFTSGAWRTRTLNTKQADSDGLCSLASNQITLAAGVYRCHIILPAYQTQRHKSRLYNTTATTVILDGSSEYGVPGVNVQTHSFIVGQFTISANQALEVQHRTNTTSATVGFGVASSLATEVYTQAQFWKIG